MEDAAVHLAKQPPAQFASVAVGNVEKNEGSSVGKSPPCGRKIDAMAGEVGSILGPIPRKPHERRLRECA